MKKTVVYIAILGILSFGVWYFLFKDGNIFGEREAGFNITDTGSVYKIFLADQQGNTILLQRDNDGWTVNGNNKASKRMTDNLLSTFHEQFAAYPVPENAHNNVIKMLTGTAVKTQVYDRKGDLLKTFYVGGQATNNQGTYMLMEGAKRPYIVQLPSYTGYLTPRYSVQLKEWRDRTAVAIAPDQLQSVEIKYLTESEYLNSFTMKRSSDSSFTVSLHPELTIKGDLNKRRVSVYSGFFQQVGFEGYLNGVSHLDSLIAAATKRCEITIEDKGGHKDNIDLYWMPVTKRSKNLATPSPGTPDEYDADRFYGIINNNKDTVVLQAQTFEKILRKGYEFYEEDEK